MSNAQITPFVELLPNDVIAKIKADHPGIDFVVVKTVAGVSAHRGLTEGEYDRYAGMLYDPATRAKSNKFVACASTLFPETEVFNGWIAKKPGIVGNISNQVLILSGYEDEVQAKKYES